MAFDPSDIEHVPVNLEQQPRGDQVAFHLCRAGWSIQQVKRLCQGPEVVMGFDELARLHKLAGALRQECEDVFWITHAAQWKTVPTKKDK